MATPKNGLKNSTINKLLTSKKTGTSILTPPSPTIEELKKDLFVAIEILNGYTENEALLNYECTQGTCKCP